MRRKFVSLTLALMFVVLAGLTACQAAPTTPPSPTPTPRTGTIVLAPAQGKAAAALTVSGTGFLSDEKVRVEIGFDQYTRVALAKAETGGVVVADKDGKFALKSFIPMTGAAPGVYTVEATGDKGTKATASLEITK